MSSTPPPMTRNPSKAARAKRVLILRLPSTLLARFPADPPTRKQSKGRPSIAVSSPVDDSKTDSHPDIKNEHTSASQTPRPDDKDSLAIPTSGTKRKAGVNGTGTSRTKLDENGNPKPKGKPGPKKRKGLPEGEAPPPVQKLGPKANQGAINDKLRALDRSGAPCRKWQRSGFQFSSFTGVRWDLPQWNTMRVGLDLHADDVHSENTGSSDNYKGEHVSSIVPSERSHNGDDGTPAMLMDVASSPAVHSEAVAA